MKKQTFLLLAGIYSMQIGLVLIFAPNAIFQGYGFATIEETPPAEQLRALHDFIFYTGANAIALGVLYILSMKTANHKALLLAGAIAIILCAVYIIYRNASANTPIAAYIDMAIRLLIGLGFIYYYFQEKE